MPHLTTAISTLPSQERHADGVKAAEDERPSSRKGVAIRRFLACRCRYRVATRSTATARTKPSRPMPTGSGTTAHGNTSPSRRMLGDRYSSRRSANRAVSRSAVRARSSMTVSRPKRPCASRWMYASRSAAATAVAAVTNPFAAASPSTPGITSRWRARIRAGSASFPVTTRAGITVRPWAVRTSPGLSATACTSATAEDECVSYRLLRSSSPTPSYNAIPIWGRETRNAAFARRTASAGRTVYGVTAGLPARW